MKKPNYRAILQAAKERKLDRLKLTAAELAGIRGKNERTGLHVAAEFGCLDQIVGGATAAQLEAARDNQRTSALYLAVAHGYVRQIKDGVTAEELANTKPFADFSLALLNVKPTDPSHPAGAVCIEELGCVNGSQDIPQKTGLHWLAFLGGLDQVKGGVTAEKLARVMDDQGFPALYWAAEEGHLDEVLQGVTAEQLAAVKQPNGLTTLHAAAIHGHLDQIKGGVTVAQLAGVANPDGTTPLHMAAEFNSLDQINGGVTAEQLAAIQTKAGQTGLHFAASYRHIQGGVTGSQLAAVKDQAGRSGLHSAAIFGCLGQIKGGVTAEDLAGGSDNAGNTPLHMAAACGGLGQIKNGVTITQLSAEKNSDGHTPLDLALISGQLFEFFTGDRKVFWNSLPPKEQELLRSAMRNRIVPAAVAELAGSGIPGFETELEGGFAKNTNVLWDGTSQGNLAVTRKLKKLDWKYPLSKRLVCRHCKLESRVMIRDENHLRHYCPGCGVVYHFDAAAYEQAALKCLKSMRRVFPWNVHLKCPCGTTVEHKFVSRDADTMSCPECGQEYQHDFAQHEEMLFEWKKSRFVLGQEPAGWTELPPRPPIFS